MYPIKIYIIFPFISQTNIKCCSDISELKYSPLRHVLPGHYPGPLPALFPCSLIVTVTDSNESLFLYLLIPPETIYAVTNVAKYPKLFIAWVVFVLLYKIQ